MIGGDNGQLDVERERAQASGEAVSVRMKVPICAMSWSFLLQVVRRRPGCQRVAAHHWKRPSPASSVNTGSARPMTEPRGNGPK